MVRISYSAAFALRRDGRGCGRSSHGRSGLYLRAASVGGEVWSPGPADRRAAEVLVGRDRGFWSSGPSSWLGIDLAITSALTVQSFVATSSVALPSTRTDVAGEADAAGATTAATSSCRRGHHTNHGRRGRGDDRRLFRRHYTNCRRHPPPLQSLEPQDGRDDELTTEPD